MPEIDWSKAEKFVSKKASKKPENKGRITLAVRSGDTVTYKDEKKGSIGTCAAARFDKAFEKAK